MAASATQRTDYPEGRAMHVIVVGCGRVGARLATSLSRAEHTVAVVDRQVRAFEHLGPAFKGSRHAGQAIDRALLLEAGIERADALASVTGRDNTNFVVASIAIDDFRVPRVVARIADPIRADIYARLGIATILPTMWATLRIQDLLVSPELHNVFTVGSAGVQLYELDLPSHLVGRTVADLSLPAEIQVVAVTRKGRGFIPVFGTSFELNDRLLVATDVAAIPKLRRMLGFPD